MCSFCKECFARKYFYAKKCTLLKIHFGLIIVSFNKVYNSDKLYSLTKCIFVTNVSFPCTPDLVRGQQMFAMSDCGNVVLYCTRAAAPQFIF